ncbi:type III pantothenate kinase [Hydrogenivirga sp. 128-5-R1-1]|uniref:type III pantothenate kinase n=1 Tax=Hydrogenivirga sp. 128-5-R1-1 TaxID=392423 RepID=UPI00015F36A6|nr:type III pantothenate kinase [Hydrogenivirga sp. 128-5-R1-1]EDP76631.1 hypothetical protein HG1285_03453 [Hydrogenivirga sp. 128-5-R1-1]
MRVLTLDVGNTTVDACVFEGDKPKPMGRLPHGKLGELAGDYDLVVVSSVKESLNEEIMKVFGDRVRFVKVSDVPIEIDYETPETLGVDRVLFAYGVNDQISEDAVLVMAGTALVVDLLLDGVFRGGFITAGLGLKLKALSEKAEGLPDVKPERLETLLGKGTRECILGGTYLESLSFIKVTAERWVHEFKRELPIVITGGEGRLFEDMGIYDPLILHRAMLGIIING